MNEEILSEIIALGEGPASEFKRNVNAAFGNELCAFANAAGGIILVGVDDDGNPVGLKHHNRLKSQVQSYARAADPGNGVGCAAQLNSELRARRIR